MIIYGDTEEAVNYAIGRRLINQKAENGACFRIFACRVQMGIYEEVWKTTLSGDGETLTYTPNDGNITWVSSSYILSILPHVLFYFLYSHNNPPAESKAFRFYAIIGVMASRMVLLLRRNRLHVLHGNFYIDLFFVLNSFVINACYIYIYICIYILGN